MVRYYGIPLTILLDRDKVFTSNFERIMIIAFNIKLKSFITFYPETDAQTEKINQFLKQYLKHYINVS